MKVALSVIGKFHTFDLARELDRRGSLSAIYTGYPRFKLRHERIDAAKIHTFPWLQAPYMALRQRHLLGRGLLRHWEHGNRVLFDRHVAAHMKDCDVFVGLSSSALATGRRARATGIRYVCDRGSTHIRAQDELLAQEHARWGQPYEGIDPRTIEREEAEYAEADLITVPSTFNRRTFAQQGVDAAKVAVLPYGVDLQRFHRVDSPRVGRLDLLFVGALSLRKGVPDLLKAYADFQHPAKSLTFIGPYTPEFITLMRQQGLWSPDIRLLGPLPQDQLKIHFSQAHALVLPSIEEGLALVQAQAMACGCPVVATPHTGCEDLFVHGQSGLIVPIRHPAALTSAFQRMADEPLWRDGLAQGALEAVRQVGGWSSYGERAWSLYRDLQGSRP